MITEKLTGNDLYKDLNIDLDFVKKVIKKEREKLRKPYLSKRKNIPGRIIEDWIYSSVTITSPKTFNKWFIKTGMKGQPEKPLNDTHIHCKGITSSGSSFYVIFRGLKYRDDGRVGHYITTVNSHVLKRIRERCTDLDSSMSADEVISRIFDRSEVSVYFPYNWIKEKEDEAKKEEIVVEELPEDYIPSAEEVWAMYEKEQQASTTKPEIPIHEYTEQELLSQMILKTAMGYFTGFLRGNKEVQLKSFFTYDTATESQKELIREMLVPAYTYYNRNKFSEEFYKQQMDVWKKTIENLQEDDVMIYQLYP